MQEKRLILDHIPVDMHRALKIESIREGRSMNSIILELIADYLDRRAKLSMAEKLLKREEEER